MTSKKCRCDVIEPHRRQYIVFKRVCLLACISVPVVVLISANSNDPDEMQYYAAFYLGLHCLP